MSILRSAVLAAFLVGLCMLAPARAQVVPETEAEVEKATRGAVRKVTRKRPPPRRKVIEIKKAVEVRGRVREPSLFISVARRPPDFSSLGLKLGIRRSFGEDLKGELFIWRMPRYLGGLAPKKGG